MAGITDAKAKIIYSSFLKLIKLIKHKFYSCWNKNLGYYPLIAALKTKLFYIL
jgi:hypothetical protein